MAAPTMDKILPPIIFLVTLMGTFIFIVQAMATTVQSNLNNQWQAPSSPGSPDYIAIFSNYSWSTWSPNPLTVTSTTTSSGGYPLVDNANQASTFSSTTENGFPINFWLVKAHIGDLSSNRHEFYFIQYSGWFGLEKHGYLARYPDDFTAMYNSTGVANAYNCTISLRHSYNFVLYSTNPSNSTNLDSQIRVWSFNCKVLSLISSNPTTNPWTIVGQLFSFTLPGIPTWLNGLIMAPILVTIGVVAYILIRGALPT